jgi:hypothetical protein
MPMNARLLRPQANKFLLDQHGGAAVAYSLRRLRSGYTGAAVRVRRSSDNDEANFTPEEVASGSVQSWVGAGNDGFVTTWFDQSGNGNNFVQATSADQPVIVSGGALTTDQSRPALSFVPNDGMTTSQSVNLGTQVSLFIVARLTRNHTDFSRLVNGMNDVRLFVGTDASEQIITGHGNGTTWSAITAQTATTWLNNTRLVTSINDGNDRQFINGVSSGSRSSAMGSFNAAIAIGGPYVVLGNQLTNQMWQGTVSELVIFSGARLSQRAAIDANIMRHYGLT